MTNGNGGNGGSDGFSDALAGQSFLKQLEDTGFFEQVAQLEDSLKRISDDIARLGAGANQRLEETENLAAHVLALESVLKVMLEQYPVDADKVRAAVIQATGDPETNPEGSLTVRAIAESLLPTAADDDGEDET